MRQAIHIYFFVGVTGEWIKHAPIVKEFQKRNIKFKIITSGQSKVHFSEMDEYIGTYKSDIALPEKANKSSAIFFVLWALKTLITAPFLLRSELKNLDKSNTYFIVQGDTVSSLIGAILAKFVFGIKLIHNEAGLSSKNLFIPFPEEICRNIIWRLSDILCAQSSTAIAEVKNLRGSKLNTVHNTLIESFDWAVNTKGVPSEIRKYKKYYYLFMHRQENIIFRKNYSKEMLEFIIKHADPKLNCVLLNNHLTSSVIESLSKNWDPEIKKRIFIAPRFPYKDFMKVLSHAEFLATDSATNQVESAYIGVPYLGLRNRTENTEGLGENVILSFDNEKIIKSFLKNYKKYKRAPMKIIKSPSKIIVDYLVDHEWS